MLNEYKTSIHNFIILKLLTDKIVPVKGNKKYYLLNEALYNIFTIVQFCSIKTL